MKYCLSLAGKTFVSFRLFIFLAVCITMPMEAAFALSVQLSVAERAGITRDKAPVTYGVPLAKASNILTTTRLGLFLGSTELPSQFRVLSRYGGPPEDTTKPIRVVLCDTQLDLSSSSIATVVLNDSGSGNASGLLASETSSSIVVNTGAATFTFTKSGNFNLFDSVSVGGTSVVSSKSNAGIEIERNGIIYASYYSPASSMRIEENGPLRAVVKARGFFRSSQGNLLLPPLGDTGLEYECRIVLYKAKSYARVYFTLISENFGWAIKAAYPNHNITYNWLRIKTTLDTGTGKVARFAGYTSPSYDTGVYSVSQSHVEAAQNESGNFSYSIKKGTSQVASGSRYDSFADLSDSQRGLMVANRWFWQTWPKAVEFNNNNVLFYLWPDTNEDYTFLGGNYKTHELLFHFHGRPDAAYNFGKELAHLKKRAVFLANSNYYATTDFFDFFPPINIKSGYVFSGGEKLQAALDTWQLTVQAKYDGSLANTNENSDFNAIREARPFIWSAGIHNGKYMNWYGWQAFGDMWRYGSYGSAGLHYNWDYVSLLHGLRFNDFNMLEIGEQMVLHHSDRVVTHDPKGTDPTGAAWSEIWFRGGGRYEHDSQMELGNYQYSTSGSNDPRTGAHTWMSGLILQYMLTGNTLYLDSINQMADHWMYNFKGNGQAGYDCSQGPCWNTPESRQVHRVIQMVTEIWKLTGKAEYLKLVSDIVTNSLLANLEDKAGGTPQGYYYYNSTVSSCCGAACNAHPFYDGLAIKPLLLAYHELANYGYSGTAQAIYAHMKRKALWYRDTIFKNYELATCGTYGTGTNAGKYFPYQIRTSWKQGCTWNNTTNDGLGYTTYATFAADAFAFLYEMEGDASWLNLARSVFKDQWLYKGREEYQSINLSSVGSVNGIAPKPAAAWLKEGNMMEKPMYYLSLEWKLSSTASPLIKSIRLQ